MVWWGFVAVAGARCAGLRRARWVGFVVGVREYFCGGAPRVSRAVGGLLGVSRVADGCPVWYARLGSCSRAVPSQSRRFAFFAMSRGWSCFRREMCGLVVLVAGRCAGVALGRLVVAAAAGRRRLARSLRVRGMGPARRGDLAARDACGSSAPGRARFGRSSCA